MCKYVSTGVSNLLDLTVRTPNIIILVLGPLKLMKACIFYELNIHVKLVSVK